MILCFIIQNITVSKLEYWVWVPRDLDHRTNLRNLLKNKTKGEMYVWFYVIQA